MLWVEGKNDIHVVCHLLRENGIELSPQDGPVVVEEKHSVEPLLDIMTVATKAAIGQNQPVGFMLDADEDGVVRWEAIRTRLDAAGCKLKKADIRMEGVIKEVGESRVGVWMMPWSTAEKGELEDFLRNIIPAEDETLPMAQKFVLDVKESVGETRRFKNGDFAKAEIATWLAIQDPPGNPYGIAIKAHKFAPGMPLAQSFVQWFRRLFDL